MKQRWFVCLVLVFYGIYFIDQVKANDEEYGIIYGALIDAWEESREDYLPWIKLLSNLTPKPSNQTTPKTTSQSQTKPQVPRYNDGSFRLSARDLSHNENVDPGGGSPDPYVIIARSTKSSYSKSNFSEWIPVFTTKRQVDTSDPDWLEELNFRLKPGQKYKFDIYDYDLFNADDFIGQVVIRSEELINLRTRGSITKPCTPEGSGELIIVKSEGVNKDALFL